ncbi:hypothetical protein SMICM304S_00774 [Streptomyces microflavus]
MQGLQGGGRGDGDQEVGAVQDLAHVPVHQAEVGRQAAGQPLRELLVGQFLDVRGVLAGLGAQLQQHLAAGVQPGVLDEPAERVPLQVGAGGRYGGLGGEHHGVAALFGAVRGSAEEGQRRFRDGRGVGAPTPSYTARKRSASWAELARTTSAPWRSEEAVGELLVDDADVLR